MEVVFLKLLDMSIAASWLILAVFVLRLVFKKAPKSIACFLWILVGIRLVCPFSIESSLSLIPTEKSVKSSVVYMQTNIYPTPAPQAPSAPSAPSAQAETEQDFAPEAMPAPPAVDAPAVPDAPQVPSPDEFALLASIIWAVSVAAMLSYCAVSYLRLRLRVRDAVRLRENLWQSEKVPMPFVLGLFRPRIYLPYQVDEQSLEYIVAHEKAHIRRKDHWIKPIGFLILSVYWFHPLVWVAYILLCRDIELACDERVIKGLNGSEKKAYSQALLSYSMPHRAVTACPLAFGEVGVKERVKSVLHYKKPAFWIIILAVLACIVTAVCLMTNPKSPENNDPQPTENMDSQPPKDNESPNLILRQTGSGSDYSGVSVSLKNGEYGEDSTPLQITWINETPEDLMFGQPFTIYQQKDGEWVRCSYQYHEEELVWGHIGYLLPAYGTADHSYHFQYVYDVTAPGSYRFETEFYAEDGEPHTAWLCFALDLSEGGWIEPE